MERSNITSKRGDKDVDQGSDATPELEGISPRNPATFPRAEDDAETQSKSPEFHDLPDPGSHVGRKDKNRPS
jgi:hypothetical protein